MGTQELGRAGEDFAAAWLQDRGFLVIERNWRCQRGELDLVATDAQTGELVAVEVKTRAGTGYGHPAEAVGRDKLVRLHALLNAFAAQQDLSGRSLQRAPRRVDVLALLWPHGASAPTAIDHYLGVIP